MWRTGTPIARSTKATTTPVRSFAQRALHHHRVRGGVGEHGEDLGDRRGARAAQVEVPVGDEHRIAPALPVVARRKRDHRAADGGGPRPARPRRPTTRPRRCCADRSRSPRRAPGACGGHPASPRSARSSGTVAACAPRHRWRSAGHRRRGSWRSPRARPANRCVARGRPHRDGTEPTSRARVAGLNARPPWGEDQPCAALTSFQEARWRCRGRRRCRR